MNGRNRPGRQPVIALLAGTGKERTAEGMPIISRFYGMVVKMYYRQSEHNPPHIHVIYGDCSGVLDIQTGDLMEGDLPNRVLKMAQEWTARHKKDLMQIWETQNFVELPPL